MALRFDKNLGTFVDDEAPLGSSFNPSEGQASPVTMASLDFSNNLTQIPRAKPSNQDITTELLGEFGSSAAQAPPSPKVAPKPQVDSKKFAEMAVASPSTSPALKEVLAKKFGLGDALMQRQGERASLQKQIEEDSSGPNISAALAAIGAGFQGRDSIAAGRSVLDSQSKSRDKKLTDFDKGTDSLIRDASAVNSAEKMDRESAEYAEMEDVNSEISKSYQTLAKQFSPSTNFEGRSANQLGKLIPSLRGLYEAGQKRLDRADARADRRLLTDFKQDEKMQALKTPFGLANTPDDAKQLKEAFEAKKNFDSKIKEMIALREKYGAEYLNREAVARGKQLSKDLLLEYKNMAKLGVLSQSDENIINAIIPADPLGQDWAPGQDPILSNLEKFQTDNDNDFNTRVATRTRAGIDSAAKPSQASQASSGSFPRQVRKSGKVASVSNQAELDEALSEGWQ